MNKDHLIYELTEEQQKALMGDGYEDKKIDGKTIETLEQDVARLDGYLKGRADSDAPKIRANAGGSQPRERVPGLGEAALGTTGSRERPAAWKLRLRIAWNFVQAKLHHAYPCRACGYRYDCPDGECHS